MEPDCHALAASVVFEAAGRGRRMHLAALCGRLKVQGKSLAIEQLVKGSLRNTAAVQPQVMVDLADDRSTSVLVAGRVPRQTLRQKGPADGAGCDHAGGGSTLPGLPE